MRERIAVLIQEKRQITVNFPAAQGGKLVSASGIITEVQDDFFLLTDIYGNTMLIPLNGFSYIEIKK